MTEEIGNKIAARSALLDFYSDRAVSFSGVFLASLFGLLTMLSLVQGIKGSNSESTIFFVVLSLAPFSIFAIIGYVALRKFIYYADIADKIEGGTGLDETLRHYAKLDELFPQTGGKIESPKEWFSKILRFIASNKICFQLSYLILIVLLVAVVYVPRFLNP